MIKQQCTTCFKVFEINENTHKCGTLSHLQKVLIPLPKQQLTKLDIICIYCNQIYPKYIYEEHIRFCNRRENYMKIVQFDDKFLSELEQKIKDNKMIGGEYNQVKEITNKLKTIKITENHIQEEAQCTICQEQFTQIDNVKVTLCNHLFHETCLQEYLIHQNMKCPLCGQLINLDQPQE